MQRPPGRNFGGKTLEDSAELVHYSVVRAYVGDIGRIVHEN
jgi:putative IMPACT (imprinted ancient) family translation regulator